MSQEGENAAVPTTPSKDAGAPTPKEAAFILAILNNMKNKPEVDWDVVAQKSGFSNGKTAATRFGQIKKWGAMNSDIDTTASTTSAPKTPKTPKTKTPKDKTKVGSGTNTTASKVSKGSPTPKKLGRKPKVVKEEEPEEPEENDHEDLEMDETLAVIGEEIEYYEAEEDSIAVEA